MSLPARISALSGNIEKNFFAYFRLQLFAPASQITAGKTLWVSTDCIAPKGFLKRMRPLFVISDLQKSNGAAPAFLASSIACHKRKGIVPELWNLASLAPYLNSMVSL